MLTRSSILLGDAPCTRGCPQSPDSLRCSGLVAFLVCCSAVVLALLLPSCWEFPLHLSCVLISILPLSWFTSSFTEPHCLLASWEGIHGKFFMSQMPFLLLSCLIVWLDINLFTKGKKKSWIKLKISIRIFKALFCCLFILNHCS